MKGRKGRTSMQSGVDDAFRTAPSSPSEVARRTIHMSVGLIYEGGLGTIAGSPNDEGGEEAEEEYEQTIDLHNLAYDEPMRTLSSTDNAPQFTPRPTRRRSHVHPIVMEYMVSRRPVERAAARRV